MKTLGVVWGPQGVECRHEDRVEAFFEGIWIWCLIPGLGLRLPGFGLCSLRLR